MKSQRMCVVCRGQKDKKELLRVVKKNGVAELDLGGKSEGRGAYICKTESCIKKAQKIHAFERSLSCTVNSSIYDMLEDCIID